MAEIKKLTREEQAKRNRELMPNVAAMVDEFRAAFPGLRLIYAKDPETGHSVGVPPEEDPDKVFAIPKNYYPTRTCDDKVRKK